MSLRITNKATPKQIALLERLEYHGQGQYATDKLTMDEAGKIIDQLFTEQKWKLKDIQEIAHDYYNFPNDINNAFGPRTGEQ